VGKKCVSEEGKEKKRKKSGGKKEKRKKKCVKKRKSEKERSVSGERVGLKKRVKWGEKV
jgi:hypothetical protein